MSIEFEDYLSGEAQISYRDNRKYEGTYVFMKERLTHQQCCPMHRAKLSSYMMIKNTHMRDNGVMALCMAKAYSNGEMDHSMKAAFLQEEKMDLVSLLSPIKHTMKAFGLQGSKMELEHFLDKMEINWKKEFGIKAVSKDKLIRNNSR